MQSQTHNKRSRRRGSKQRPAIIPLQGEIQKNRRGFAFLLHKPEDIFIPPGFARDLLTGDTIKAWIDSRKKEVLKLEVVKRSLKSFIGTYEAGLGNRVVILEDKTMREEVLIRQPPNLPGLRHGHKVLVEITKYEPHLEGKITRSFGPTLAPKYDTLATVIKAQWPQEFSEEALKQAEKLSKDIPQKEEAHGYSGRKDLRLKSFVTIDGKDARDFDDAILVEKTASGYVLYVSIADVSEFVRQGSTLNQEAYDRATSVYFPEWVIPMLPEALSNHACSLRPQEEKLTLTCEMHFDANGKKRSVKVYESVISSIKRCIYEEVQKEWEGGNLFWQPSYELFKKIQTSRMRRGSLDLDLPESKVILDDQADAIDIQKIERLDSHRLIEEFMIAANESVTELIGRERHNWPFVFRIHESPEAKALERFEKFASALGLRPKLKGKIDPKDFAQFIDSLKHHPNAPTLHYLLLRSLKQARYEPVNLKHFGLASGAYTHFTSPIRRYPDLMVHRILKHYIHHQHYNDAQLAEFMDYLVSACDQCSKQERKAENLERTVIKIKKARFMSNHLGETFHAVIGNVTENGLFVELDKWFVEGLLPIDELTSDYFEFIEEKMMLQGKRSGKKFKIGDPIRVTLLRTDIDNGYIDFTLAGNTDGAL